MSRTSPFVSLVLFCGLLTACDNGPGQTYKPPPAGASSWWNNGDTGSTPLPGTAGTATAAAPGFSGFVPTSNGQNTNLANICTAARQQQTWAAMDVAPVVYPNIGANLNLAGTAYKGADGKIGNTCSTPGQCTMTGPTTWQGLTIEQAEQVLCQGVEIGDAFGDGNQDVAWGGNGEVDAEYLISNHHIIYLGLGLVGSGYLGTMTFTSPDGSATYTLALQNATPITRALNGSAPAPITLDWAGYLSGTNPDAINEFDNLYRAFENTYFHSIWTGNPEPAGTTCNQTGACVIGQFAGYYAYFAVPAAGFGFWVSGYLTPAGQYPNRIDINLAQLMNYSGAAPYLALSAKGPYTIPQLLGKATTPCSLAFGLDYAQFLANCVQTDGEANANGSDLNELLSSLSHDDETFNFNIPGVDLNFGDQNLSGTQIITDWIPGSTPPTPQNSPQAGDLANELSIDQSTLGNLVDDYIGPGAGQAQDLHGAGALWNEFRRLVITNVYVETTGAPPPGGVDALIARCIPKRDPATGEITDPHWDPENPAAWIAYEISSGCTGAENLISADTTSGDDPVNVGPATAVALDPSYALGMKLGHQKGVFCLDAESNNSIQAQIAHGATAVGPQYCAAPFGEEDDILTAMANQVWTIYGQGKPANLPVDMQDHRFFFKMYGQALIKTLEWLGDFDLTRTPASPPIQPVDSYPIELNDLFFDSIGSGQFEQMEYVDRRFVCADSTPAHPDNDCTNAQPPTDIIFSADVLDGIMNGYDFTRYLYRGETALYRALQEPDPASTTMPPATYAIGRASNLLLTNLAGSPVLANWPSYQCAITNAGPDYVAPNGVDYPTATPEEVAACQHMTAPYDSRTGQLLIDADGNPIFSAYSLAFPDSTGLIQSPLQLGSANLSVTTGTGVTAEQLEFEAEALVTVPTLDGSTVTTLLPYLPQQPSVGFPVMVNADYDQWVATAQIDFTGVTISAVVDFVQNPPPSGTPNQILAVESTDFLGDLFLCYDAATGDLLTTRMYDNVARILDWLNAHPNAYFGSDSSECNLIVRWSPYDNYVDLIETTTNGVRIDTTQGGGFGRVVGAQVYYPQNYGVQ
jgi:hypothetical protein